MRIRSLVPALACLAAAPLATAADSTSVKFDGFVDSVYSLSHVSDSDPVVLSKGGDSKFTYDAKIGIAATITEKVSAQVDLVLNDANAVAAKGNDQSAVSIRQAYGAWKINSEVELKTGKFISDYGWVAAYAPGLYRVKAGPILDLYGQDQVGANVKYAKGDLTVAATVANGFFDDAENNNAGQAGQDKAAFAYGVDAAYSLGKNGTVNAELVYDQDVAGMGSNGIHFGLNTTLTPSEPLTIGAEFIYQTISLPDGATGDDQSEMGFLAMANFKLGNALKVPASVTGMFQYVAIADNFTTDVTGDGNADDGDASVVELSLALLTNPAGTDKLGANLEVFVQMSEFEPKNTASTETTTLGFAAELLYVF